MKWTDLAVEWTESQQVDSDTKKRTEGIFTVFQNHLSHTEGHRHQYTTISGPDLAPDNKSDLDLLGQIVEQELKMYLQPSGKKVCIVGLGNEWMTADALGPRVIQKLQQNYLFLEQELAYLLQPGVTLQSGMETHTYIASLVKEVKPDHVILIDALKATSQARLCRLIQMTDAGIQPGSGLHTSRKELVEETIGVPTLAIGVPTVISSLDVTYEQMDYALQHFLNRVEVNQSSNPLASLSFWQAERKDLSTLEPIFGQWVAMTDLERRQFIYENAGQFQTVVTMTSIYEWIERWSEIIANALVNVLTPTPSA